MMVCNIFECYYNNHVRLGRWKEDKANGYGTYLHVNGSKYEGNWRNDLQHGYGVEIWVDKSKYEGNYLDGKKSGTGQTIFEIS